MMFYEVVAVKQVDIALQTIEETLTYQGQAMVNVNISYPAMQGELPVRCARRFNRHYVKRAQALRRHAQDSLYGSAVEDWHFSQQKGYPFNAYELTQVYEVTFNALPVLSLYSDVYEYTGGAHGMTDRTGNTWDLARCRMLELKDLFLRGYDYTNPILKYVAAEAFRRQQSGEAQYFEGMIENIQRYFDPKNFFLSCRGLQVFYPLYSIAPYYVGIQVFTVPYSMFGDNLVYPLVALCT
jgi:hypothetical protein